MSLVIALGLMFGCANPCSSKPVALEPPYYVPSSVVLQTTDGVARINPYQVLASADAEDFFVGREEKAVYGSVVMGGASAFTTYTYDQQRISGPWDNSYKYRYVVQQGISFP